MNNCSNCKHWRKIRNVDYKGKNEDGEEFVWPGPHGECHLITKDSFKVQEGWTNGRGDIIPDTPKQSAWISEGNIHIADKEIDWIPIKCKPEYDHLHACVSESSLITKAEFCCNLHEYKEKTEKDEFFANLIDPTSENITKIKPLFPNEMEYPTVEFFEESIMNDGITPE